MPPFRGKNKTVFKFNWDFEQYVIYKQDKELMALNQIDSNVTNGYIVHGLWAYGDKKKTLHKKNPYVIFQF